MRKAHDFVLSDKAGRGSRQFLPWPFLVAPTQVNAQGLLRLPRLPRVKSRSVLYGGKFRRRKRDWKQRSGRYSRHSLQMV